MTRARRSRAALAALGAAFALAAAACGGPLLVLPGGALAGEPAPVPARWEGLESGVFELETRPSDPYSVQLNYIVRDGVLYVDPAEGRRWLEHLRADPRVRVRIDGRVYEMKAVQVGRPGELAGFDPDRFVYRLEAR